MISRVSTTEKRITNYFLKFLEKCHIIIFVVDIKSNLGTNDEKQLLESIKNIRSIQQKLSFTSDVFIVINKWDNVTPEYEYLKKVVKDISKEYIFDAQFEKLSALTRYTELFSLNNCTIGDIIAIDNNWENFVNKIDSVIINHIPHYYLYNLKLHSKNTALWSSNLNKYNTLKYLHNELSMIERKLDCKYCKKDLDFLFQYFQQYRTINFILLLLFNVICCMLIIVIFFSMYIMNNP